MKNLFLTLAFFLTINLCCVGQIDTHVLEFNVGKSTKNEVIKILQQKYSPNNVPSYFDNGDNINVFKRIKLWGGEWGAITFSFKKNILYRVSFSHFERNNTIHILNIFDTVFSELNNAYGQYNITNNPQSLFQQFRDNTFSIILSTSRIDSTDDIGLTFTDLVLYNQAP